MAELPIPIRKVGLGVEREPICLPTYSKRALRAGVEQAARDCTSQRLAGSPSARKGAGAWEQTRLAQLSSLRPGDRRLRVPASESAVDRQNGKHAAHDEGTEVIFVDVVRRRRLHCLRAIVRRGKARKGSRPVL